MCCVASKGQVMGLAAGYQLDFKAREYRLRKITSFTSDAETIHYPSTEGLLAILAHPVWVSYVLEDGETVQLPTELSFSVS